MIHIWACGIRFPRKSRIHFLPMSARSPAIFPSTSAGLTEELDGCFSVPSAETEWFAREMGRVVNDFVGALDQEERVLFLRRYWFSHPVTLIANDLHMSENNVSVKLFRIREKLKEYLGEEGFSI